MTAASVRRFALYGLGALLALYFGNAVLPLVSYKGVLYWMVLAFLVFVVVDRHRVVELVTEPASRPFVYLPIALLALSLLPMTAMHPGIKSQQILLFSVILLLVCLLILTELPTGYLRRLRSLLCAVLLIGAGVHLYGQLQHDARMAYYSNPHYAAQFCMLAMLLLGYFMSRFCVLWQRAVLLLAILACGWVLINTLSRPAWIALTLTAAGVIVLFCRPRQQLIGLAGLIVLLGLMYGLLPEQFASGIDDLARNFRTEERVQIWSDGVRMQLASAPIHWIVGHGPGSYAQFFKDFYSADAPFYFFPHNFLLELLFESGLIGLILVALFYVYLYRLIAVLRRQSSRRAEAVLLFSCISVNLLFAFLTMPFYSRYLLLIQAPFIALAIHWQRQRDDIASSANHGLGSAIVSASASAVSMTETEKADS